MTETDWLSSTDPQAMLRWLMTPRDVGIEGGYGGVSDRKLRLFACGCCHQIWHLLKDARSRNVVEVAERYADGLATEDELTVARKAAEPATWTASSASAAWVAWEAADAAEWAAMARAKAGKDQADLLRHIIGNPFRPWWRHGHEIYRPDRTHFQDWRFNGSVDQLAHALYDGDPGAAPLLHDALIDAGYPELAEHFRESDHPKGCWVLDLILGKE